MKALFGGLIKAVIILFFLLTLLSCESSTSNKFDPTPPQVSIISPKDGDKITEEEILVEVSAQDTESSVKAIEINGVPAVKAGTNYIATVPIINNGSFKIEAIAWNASDINASAYVTVLVDVADTTPPELFINELRDGIVLRSSHISFTGHARDVLSGIKYLKVNGTQYEVDPSDGSFNFTLTLDEGPSKIVFDVADEKDNLLHREYSVTVDTEKPELVRIAPEQNTVANSFMLKVAAKDSGTGVKSVIAEVEILSPDDKTISKKDLIMTKTAADCDEIKALCEYSAEIKTGIPSGKININVRAVDSSGSGDYAKVDFPTLNIDSLPPIVALITPKAGDVLGNSIQVEGKVADDSGTVEKVYISGTFERESGSSTEPVEVTLNFDKIFKYTLPAQVFKDIKGEHPAIKITAKAVDSSGNFSEDTVDIILNRTPVIIATYENSTEVTSKSTPQERTVSVAEAGTITMSLRVDDPDGDFTNSVPAVIELVKKPQGAQFANNEFLWTGHYFQSGAFDTTFTVKDCVILNGDPKCVASSEDTLTITIDSQLAQRQLSNEIGIERMSLPSTQYVIGSSAGFIVNEAAELCWVEPDSSIAACRDSSGAVRKIAGNGRYYPASAKDQDSGALLKYNAGDIRFTGLKDMVYLGGKYIIADAAAGFIWEINGTEASIIAGGGKTAVIEDSTDPYAIAIIPNSLFIMDGKIGFTSLLSHQIAYLEAGVVRLLAGNGSKGGSEGEKPEESFLSEPSNVVQKDGIILFSDHLMNGKIKKIENNAITTVLSINGTISSMAMMGDDLYGSMLSETYESGIYRMNLALLLANPLNIPVSPEVSGDIGSVKVVGNEIYYSSLGSGIINNYTSSDTVGAAFTEGMGSAISLVSPGGLVKTADGLVIFDRGIQKILFYNNTADNVTKSGMTIHPGEVKIIGGKGSWKDYNCIYNAQSANNVRINMPEKIYTLADGQNIYFTNCSGISMLSLADGTISTVTTGSESRISNNAQGRGLILNTLSAMHVSDFNMYFYSDGRIWRMATDSNSVKYVAGGGGSIITQKLFTATTQQERNNAQLGRETADLVSEVNALTSRDSTLFFFSVQGVNTTKIYALNNSEYITSALGVSINPLSIALLTEVSGKISKMQFRNSELYFGVEDGAASYIKKIKTNSVIENFIGGGTCVLASCRPEEIQIEKIGGFVFDDDGRIIFADKSRKAIFKYRSSAEVKLISEDNDFIKPADIAVEGSIIFVSDQTDHKIKKLTLGANDIKASLEVLTGTGEPGSTGDGFGAINAKLNSPENIVLRGTVVFFIEKGTSEIRGIEIGNSNTTVYGVAISKNCINRIIGGGDGIGEGSAIQTTLISTLHGMALDETGTFFFGDYGNSLMRSVSDDSNSTNGGTDGLDARDSVYTSAGRKGVNLSAGDGKLINDATIYSISNLLYAGGKRYIIEGFDKGRSRVRVISGSAVNCYAGCGKEVLSDGSEIFDIILPEVIASSAITQRDDIIFYTGNISSEQKYQGKLVGLSGSGHVFFIETAEDYIRNITIDELSGAVYSLSDSGVIYLNSIK